ncbi:MAG TPA: 16S rRNA (guanine(527)-N(7))-methyltransferase RsmG [Mobilitalea sp.]|nr:16S rRNA (guanine(527)-N(7))-methyltransferase RsmG [Mobilitalea sp.]
MDYNIEQGILELKKGLKILNIELEEYQIKQFMDYYQILVEWNNKMNLTSITELKEVIHKHFLDSLSIVEVYRPIYEKIIDVGTGAGFPGIPIKIAFPNTKVVLMDSLKKRIGFLEEVIKELNLCNIEVIHARAEDLGRDESFRESFDLCTSRAVAKLSVLTEYCLPFVKKGGYFIPYKSGNINEELQEAQNAIKILGGTVKDHKEFILPLTDIGRSMIMIEKIKETPKKYPRTAGKPSKEPL